MVQDEFAHALAAEVAAILSETRKQLRVEYSDLIAETGIPERTLIRILKAEAPLPIEKYALICASLTLDPFVVMRTATGRARARLAGTKSTDPAPVQR